MGSATDRVECMPSLSPREHGQFCPLSSTDFQILNEQAKGKSGKEKSLRRHEEMKQGKQTQKGSFHPFRDEITGINIINHYSFTALLYIVRWKECVERMLSVSLCDVFSYVYRT